MPVGACGAAAARSASACDGTWSQAPAADVGPLQWLQSSWHVGVAAPEQDTLEASGSPGERPLGLADALHSARRENRKLAVADLFVD